MQENAMYPKTGQGPAVIANSEDIKHDDIGYTHPNLHRRVDPQEQEFSESREHHPRSYDFAICKTDSYRTTTLHTHDEESSIEEIP